MYAELTGITKRERQPHQGSLQLLRAGWAALSSYVQEAAQTAPALVGLPTARTLPLLHGRGVSGGCATGRARLVLNESDMEAFEDGDVLVAEYGSIAVLACLPLAAAVVLTYGGELSAAAIHARELGIPAVFGVAEASCENWSGSWVTVNGNAGTVHLTSGGW